MKLYVGTSGYSYRHWFDVFYPEDLSKYKLLEFYAEHFNTVELNVTFYRIPKESTFKSWYKRTPDNFAFAVKANRRLTHLKRLNVKEDDVKGFMEIIGLLKEKLAVVLWQLPPSFKKDTDKLVNLLEILKGYNVKYVFEFRNQTWLDKETCSILKDFGATLCISDWPFHIEPATEFDFYYIRRHGAEGDAPFSRSYTDEEIKEDARLVSDLLKKDKEVFVFFNNDTEGFAVKNAQRLKEEVLNLCPELA